jgi:hypothetical protein
MARPTGSSRPIGRWADDFHERRRGMSSFGNPFPGTHRHTFKGAAAGTYFYFDPSACRTGAPPMSTIVISP